MAAAATMTTKRAGKVSAAMATGGSRSETSGLAAPPLKKTMALSVPMSNSNWTNSSQALAERARATRHWARPLNSPAMATMPRSGTWGTGMSSRPGPTMTS